MRRREIKAGTKSEFWGISKMQKLCLASAIAPMNEVNLEMHACITTAVGAEDAKRQDNLPNLGNEAVGFTIYGPWKGWAWLTKKMTSSMKLVVRNDRKWMA